MKRILVTGVGSIIGYGIIYGLRQSLLPLEIFGIDIYINNYGRTICDEFITGVRADAPGFIDFINGLIEKYKIDFIFTGIEEDLYKLWKYRDEVRAPVLFNNEICMDLSKDKYYTYRYLSKFDLNLIPTLKDSTYRECVERLGPVFLLKPVSSSASKGIEIIKNEEEFNVFTKRLSGNCVYQRIIGSDQTEYTVGTFGDGKGNILDSIILKRSLSRDGSTSKAETSNDPAVMAYVRELVSVLKPEGPMNIQVRKEDEKVFLLEINPRISSSCSIRTLLGYNEPAHCINYFLLNKPIIPAPKKEGKVIRYISDHLVSV